ncbi:hypothetical protein CLU86_0446 [Acidovorax sp. 62]|uniref:hypothetical protein n=1 Tax=Acidovorax sp. 62 TaxID=2035203 RepID=UPI000C4BB154|nr:hypothetical protein [Acidovorax sp. 62]PIF89570.1 hypothetical protein CLU86_0446 [Acidovorax sp. 62]
MNEKHPLRRFAPSPSLASLRDAGGGRSQRPQVERRIRDGAALARLPWPCERQFHAMDN